VLSHCFALLFVVLQRYFGTAVGKGRQGAKNEIEKLKLEELSCQEGIKAVAKMWVSSCYRSATAKFVSASELVMLVVVAERARCACTVRIAVALAGRVGSGSFAAPAIHAPRTCPPPLLL
jgi:20S proteasome alpha/beta subunit